MGKLLFLLIFSEKQTAPTAVLSIDDRYTLLLPEIVSEVISDGREING
jgi:hypothetical protein